MHVGDHSEASAALSPGKRPNTHFTAGSVGFKAGLNGCGRSRPLQGFDLRTVQPFSESLFCENLRIWFVANKTVLLKFNVGYVWQMKHFLLLHFLIFLKPCALILQTYKVAGLWCRLHVQLVAVATVEANKLQNVKVHLTNFMDFPCGKDINP
jgi:hypothetical protein